MMENKKVIRHLDAPRTFGEWLHRYRFTIARRFVQFCILLASGHSASAGKSSVIRFLQVIFLLLESLTPFRWLIRLPLCSAWSLSIGFHRNP